MQRRALLQSGFSREEEMGQRFRWLCVVACCLGFCSGLAQSSNAEIVWARTLAAALTQASAEHKMIISDMVADWCGWCKVMDKETWGQESVIALSSKYVFLKLDIEKDEDGISFAKKFKIRNLPTVLILTSAGEEFERIETFLPAQEFLEALKVALADPNSLGNIRLSQTRDPQNIELNFKLAYELFNRGTYREAETHFAQIVLMDAQNKSTRADASLFYLAVCKADRLDIDGCMSTLERLRRDFPGSNVVPSSYLLAGQALLRGGKRAEAREQVQAFLTKYPTHPLLGKAKELLAQIGDR
jgi:TolA-binding protein